MARSPVIQMQNWLMNNQQWLCAPLGNNDRFWTDYTESLQDTAGRTEFHPLSIIIPTVIKLRVNWISRRDSWRLYSIRFDWFRWWKSLPAAIVIWNCGGRSRSLSKCNETNNQTTRRNKQMNIDRTVVAPVDLSIQLFTKSDLIHSSPFKVIMPWLVDQSIVEC